jgi:hypothetical protein
VQSRGETRFQKLRRLWHLHSETVKGYTLGILVAIVLIAIMSTAGDAFFGAGDWITHSKWWLRLPASVQHLLLGVVPGGLGMFWLRSEIRGLKADGMTFYRIRMFLGSIVLTAWGIYQVIEAGMHS